MRAILAVSISAALAACTDHNTMVVSYTEAPYISGPAGPAFTTASAFVSLSPTAFAFPVITTFKIDTESDDGLYYAEIQELSGPCGNKRLIQCSPWCIMQLDQTATGTCVFAIYGDDDGQSAGVVPTCFAMSRFEHDPADVGFRDQAIADTEAALAVCLAGQ